MRTLTIVAAAALLTAPQLDAQPYATIDTNLDLPDAKQSDSGAVRRGDTANN